MIDLDIKGFFDNWNHELMMKSVRSHTDEKLIHFVCGEVAKNPQCNRKIDNLSRGLKELCKGGIISPLFANIFMHYVFDKWLERHLSFVKFERFADDSFRKYKIR